MISPSHKRGGHTFAMLILFIVEHFNLFFQALFLNIFNYYLSLAHYHYLPYWFLDKSVFSVAHANSFRRIIKGTHSVYFSSSLYIINQKHMIPRTHFHCITTWVARSSGWNSAMHLLILWFLFTSQMALLSSIYFYFDCKTRLCLIVPGRQEKIKNAPPKLAKVPIYYKY